MSGKYAVVLDGVCKLFRINFVALRCNSIYVPGIECLLVIEVATVENNITLGSVPMICIIVF